MAAHAWSASATSLARSIRTDESDDDDDGEHPDQAHADQETTARLLQFIAHGVLPPKSIQWRSANFRTGSMTLPVALPKINPDNVADPELQLMRSLIA